MSWAEGEEAIRSKVESDLSALSPVWMYAKPAGYDRGERNPAVEYIVQYGSVAPLGVGVYADPEDSGGDRTSGFLQFDIYWLGDTAPRTAHDASEVIRRAFRGQRIQLTEGGEIRFGTPFPFDPGRDGTFNRRTVSVPFEADDI